MTDILVERLRITASLCEDGALMIEAANEIERLRGYAERLEEEMERALPRIGQLENEIEKLRSLLRHADTAVVWEDELTRSGFQEEIEAALGYGKSVTETEP